MSTTTDKHSTRSHAAHGHDDHHGHGGKINHETSDAHVRPLIAFGVVLGVGLLLSMGLMWFFLTFFGPGERGTTAVGPGPALAATPILPSGPRLQANGRSEEDLLIAAQEERLNSYGQDAENGATHIPIDVAIQLIVERGVEGTAP